MKKIKMLVVGAMMLLASVAGLVVLGQPASAATCPAGSLRGDGAQVKTLADCNVEEPETPLMETVMNIIRFAIAVIGLVAVVVIIMGGVGFQTSTGDPAKAAKAKNTIMYGVIGLVIAILSFAIVNFILDNVFGSSSSADSGSSSSQSSSSSSE